MKPTLYTGAILNPIDPTETQWIPEGALVVSEDGSIAYIGSREHLPPQFQSLPVQEFLHHIIAPGFVDLHTHLPQLHCRGVFPHTATAKLDLLSWLDLLVFPEEAKFRNPEYARSVAQDFFHELIRCGTTTAMVFASSYTQATDIAFEEADRSALRIIMGKTMMDRNVPEALCEHTDTAVGEVKKLIERWHRKSDRLWYAITPRFAASCSMHLLEACGTLAQRYDTFIQTHVNESLKEIELVRTLFPQHKQYLRVYEEAGLLSPKTVLAHSIHASEEEIDLCARSHAAIAHCPDSNLFLGSGRFPLGRYEQTKIRFGLGSDIGAGTSLSMFRIMRAMSYAQDAALPPAKPFYYATLGGARALSLDDSVGSFEIGKSFDAIVVDAESMASGKPFHTLTPTEAASQYVYRTVASDVESVFIQGKELKRSFS